MKEEDFRKISLISDLNRRLCDGINIIDELTNNHVSKTSQLDEQISYDIRAGEDIREYKKDGRVRNRVADRIYNYIANLDVTRDETLSILECGCGEGLNLTLIQRIHPTLNNMIGIDISWSRLKCAKEFSKENETSVQFVKGDLFHLPVYDRGIDIVFTMQAIYAMGGYEKTLLAELYRVTNRYLILIEPCYEMASTKAQERMSRLNYVKGLKEAAASLNMKVIQYELFKEDSNPLNPAACMIIEKPLGADVKERDLCCPITHSRLRIIDNSYLFTQEGKLSYPIIKDIPCLSPENAVITTQMV